MWQNLSKEALPHSFHAETISEFLIGLFQNPAYLQHAPLPEEPFGSGMLRPTSGYWYHGTLTPPGNARSRPRQPGDRSIIVPIFSIMANSRTTRQFSLSVDRSPRRSGGLRGRRQVATRKEERAVALIIQFSRSRKRGLFLFILQRT